VVVAGLDRASSRSSSLPKRFVEERGAAVTVLFGHSIRSEVLALYVVETLLCFVAVYSLLGWSAGQAEGVDGGMVAAAALLALCVGLIAGASGLYDSAGWGRTGRLVVSTALATLLAVLLAHLASRLLGRVEPDRSAAFLALVQLSFAAVILISRLGFNAAARGGLIQRRILVVGQAGEGFDTAPDNRPEPFRIVERLEAGALPAGALAPERLRRLRIWAVVAENMAALPQDLRSRLRAAGVKLLDTAAFREQRFNRVDVGQLAADWLASARGANASWLEATLHRGFDVAMGVALVLLTLPLLLLTALAIKLDSPGPVFYRQMRVGLHNRPFMLLKFRSMVVDAEVGGAARWATQQDPRVTRVGRFIRLTRIDEIPQVVNVLRGDMAFVGPRPERPAFVAQLRQTIAHYDDRACVKPGITGWAQVNYPYGASVDDARMKLTYDLYYIRRRSLFLDLLILVATVRVVLFQEGSR